MELPDPILEKALAETVPFLEPAEEGDLLEQGRSMLRVFLALQRQDGRDKFLQLCPCTRAQVLMACDLANWCEARQQNPNQPLTIGLLLHQWTEHLEDEKSRAETFHERALAEVGA